MMRIKIVIPCYNEGERIIKTLDAIREYISKFPTHFFTVVAVNDGSKDNTLDVIRGYSEKLPLKYVNYSPNRGKGHAVKKGMINYPGFDYCIFTDADGSSHLKYILPAVLEDKYDIIITDRELPGSEISDVSPMRFISTRLYNLTKKILLSEPMYDTQNGLKAYRGEIAHKLFKASKIDGYCFDVEVLHIARKHNYDIHRVPVVWLNEPEDSRVKFKHNFIMFRELVKIRSYSRAGDYDNI
jgi:dolichyl-phosphate beta-glucosyltransferase